MTNREKMIELLSKNTEESDLEFYEEFCDSDSHFRKRVLGYIQTSSAYAIELNNEYKSNKEMYEEIRKACYGK